MALPEAKQGMQHTLGCKEWQLELHSNSEASSSNTEYSMAVASFQSILKPILTQDNVYSTLHKLCRAMRVTVCLPNEDHQSFIDIQILHSPICMLAHYLLH